MARWVLALAVLLAPRIVAAAELECSAGDPTLSCEAPASVPTVDFCDAPYGLGIGHVPVAPPRLEAAGCRHRSPAPRVDAHRAGRQGSAPPPEVMREPVAMTRAASLAPDALFVLRAPPTRDV